jgi:purine-binding chemotaxis protein CheW
MVDLAKAREKAKKERQKEQEQKASRAKESPGEALPEESPSGETALDFTGTEMKAGMESEKAAAAPEAALVVEESASKTEERPSGPPPVADEAAPEEAKPAAPPTPPPAQADLPRQVEGLSAEAEPGPGERPEEKDAAPSPAVPALWRCLTFEVGNELYGIPIEHIDEIIPVQPVTDVPNVPSVITGIMSLRGRIVTVVDSRERLGHRVRPPTEETRIVVLAQHGELFGLWVDGVKQVVSVPEESIEETTGMVAAAQNPYLRGVYHSEREMVILLDLEKFLDIRLAP